MATSLVSIEQLEADLQRYLRERATIEQYVESLRRFRDAGGLQCDALRLVEQLRADESNSDMEDQLCDVLDVISGFVCPNWQVW